MFVEYGALSQLQLVVGKNFAPQYGVILRKVLKVFLNN